MNIYDQQPDETPVEWVNRVIKTVAFRLLYAAAFLFALGYFVGSLK